MLGQAMEREIREQPAALIGNSERYLAEARAYLSGRRFDMILLAARGSSDNAALFARYLFEIALGIPVSLAAPSVLTRYGVRVNYKNCLAIGLSQSGAAPDVAELLEALRSEGNATLAITNTPESRVVEAAESAIELGVGDESSVAATKTFTASLLALLQVARSLGAELPEPTVPSDAWIDDARSSAESACGPIVRLAPVFALGRGYGFGIAFETALKLMECALIPCKAYSTADFQHGPRALAGPGSAAIVFGEVSPDLARQGCAVIQAPPVPVGVHETSAPMWNAVFGQWLALLAARARGLDPDAPQFIQKVTETL